MKEVNVKRILRNGNLSIRFSDVPGTIVTEVSHNNESYPAIINVSNASILLKDAYNTTSNGWCDNLVINPNEGIIQLGAGSAWSFGTYMVFDYIDVEQVRQAFEKYFTFENESVFVETHDNMFVVTGQVNGFGSMQLAWMDNEWRYSFDLPNGAYQTLDNICEDLGGINPRQFAGHITTKTLRCE